MPTRMNSAAHFAATLNGAPVFQGVIVATTTKNNNDTAVPFANTTTAASPSVSLVADGTLAGRTLLVQSDADCHIAPVTVNTGTVTTANGLKLFANERVVLTMANAHGWLAAVSVSGTANVRVWEIV